MNDAEIRGRVQTPTCHQSAHLHVSGEALFTDDLPEPRFTLYVAIGVSTYAKARIKSLKLDCVRQSPGVVATLAAHDIPGANILGLVVPDDPVFAETQVECVGQPIFAVAATTSELAQRAVDSAVIEYEPLPPVLTVEQALSEESFVLPTERLCQGNASRALESAPHRLQGQFKIGGQEHFYLEGQVALVIPEDDGAMTVYSSTQFPSQVQQIVARALGTKRFSDITVVCRRMGGAFGGKETQAAFFACVSALFAAKTGQAVKFRPNRSVDMTITGKRHDFLADYDVGFDGNGKIAGYSLDLASRCGMSADLSGSVNDRAMFHSDNCYYLENITINSRRCKTNTVSNTAFRGFGAPQGMMVIEHVIDEIARYLGKDPLDVRKSNFYRLHDRNTTPYGMSIEDNLLHEIVPRLEKSSRYHQRRGEIDHFNLESPFLKRGLALTPVKFGVSFTAKFMNQAGALVNVYTDGSVQINHGGTEMGQGLHTKIAQVVAEELQIDIDRIKVSATDTSKVPNASATAASAGSDLNGKAAQQAARTIKSRLSKFVSDHFKVPVDRVVFKGNQISVGDEIVSFAELVKLAYSERVSLSATGFYRTPKLNYNRETSGGRPFYYFAYGAAVSEVVIDTLSGETKLLQVDILHDCGHSLNPAIDRGQIEGGFIQGMGWLTMEELVWDDFGVLKTNAPSTYKIPVCSDCPGIFNVELLHSAPNPEETIFRSKAVGEPPLMLAISVFHAIKDAIAAVGQHRLSPHLNSPATPEVILMSIQQLKARLESVSGRAL